MSVANCEWREDSDGNWDTGCGETFCFESDGPTENRCRFCNYCGGALMVVKYVEEEEHGD